MRFFKKDELKLLWPFYLDALFITILFIFPAFYIIYFRNVGFSLAQIGFFISSMSLAGVLFEIPTGALADIFGRKFSTILGLFLSGLAIISIMFFENFYLLLFLFFLVGMAGTLVSGADDAWIVDLLHHKKKKNLIHEFYTKRHSFMSVALLMAGIIGALLVKKFGLGIIWPITGGSMILTSIIFLFGKEHFVKKKQKYKKHIKELLSHTKNSISYSLKHKTISLILTASVIIMFMMIFAGDITWYPFLQDLGFQEHWFGYLFSATFALGIFIPYFTKPLIKKIGGYKKYLMAVLSLMFLLLFLIGFINALVLVIIIYILFMSMYDFYGPVREIFFQKFVPGKMRATIGSFKNMITALAVIIVYPLAGFAADKIGPQYTIFIGAFILIPVIILYSKIKE